MRYAFAALIATSASLGAQIPDSPIPVELRPNAPPPPNSASAVATLRAYYFAQDFEGGTTVAAQLVKRFPASAEVRAWIGAHNRQAKQTGEPVIAG